MEDSLAEDRHSPVPGLVHRYPDRVLMLVTTQCASYCRYCTRSRIVGDPTQNFNRKDHEAQLEYLRRTPQVRDVLISGGDGADPRRRSCSSRSCAACARSPTSRSSGSARRVPVFLPQRIDDELCEMLEKYHPLWINLHFNHPNEITPEVIAGGRQADRGGLPVGNQSVLLAGVNDCVHIQRALVHKLVENRIRPYYLYQCDLVEGAGHFRTPVGKGLEIMEGAARPHVGLRGPDLRHRCPRRRRQDPGHAELPDLATRTTRSCCGTTRATSRRTRSPRRTRSTTRRPARYCQAQRAEPGQSGVLGLLEGERMWIEPKGFEETHSRGNTEAPSPPGPVKWVPFGVGAHRGPRPRAAPRARARRRQRRAPRRPRSLRARSRGHAMASRPPRPRRAALAALVGSTAGRSPRRGTRPLGDRPRLLTDCLNRPLMDRLSRGG